MLLLLLLLLLKLIEIDDDVALLLSIARLGLVYPQMAPQSGLRSTDSAALRHRYLVGAPTRSPRLRTL